MKIPIIILLSISINAIGQLSGNQRVGAYTSQTYERTEPSEKLLYIPSTIISNEYYLIHLINKEIKDTAIEYNKNMVQLSEYRQTTKKWVDLSQKLEKKPWDLTTYKNRIVILNQRMSELMSKNHQLNKKINQYYFDQRENISKKLDRIYDILNKNQGLDNR